MKSLAWTYLDKQTTARLIGLAVIQQIISALSTYSLAKAGFSLGSTNVFLFWVILSLASHLAVPLCAVLVRPLETKLTFRAYKNFLNHHLHQKSSDPTIWVQKEKRETFLASIASETDSYLGAIIFVGLDLFSYVLSLVLGVLILGFVLDSAFVGAFAAAGLLSGIAYLALQEKLFHASESDQEARTKFSSFLLLAWDNIFLNNSCVSQRYEKNFEERFQQSQNKAVTATKWNEGMVAILSAISSLPIFFAILWMAVEQQESIAFLTGLLVTIPRQLAMLGTFRSIFQSVASFISFEAKLKSLVLNTKIESMDITSRVKISEISLGPASLRDLNDVVAFVKEQRHGRITLRGKNGVGKSTLLLYLNKNLESSFYLPSHSHILLDNADCMSPASTGEQMIKNLQYIMRCEAKFVLLDEWDANLDNENLGIINKMLTEVSNSKTVIEVRHRAEVS